MNVRFLTLAQQEVDDAYEWFEEKSEGKGLEFLDELDRVVRLIRSFPLAAIEIEPEIRRCLIPRFPYALIYGIDERILVVIAGIELARRAIPFESQQKFPVIYKGCRLDAFYKPDFVCYEEVVVELKALS